MNSTSRSNSGTSRGADSQNRPFSDRSICSSPTPGAEGEGEGPNGVYRLNAQATGSPYSPEPSLGVYFAKEDHEFNDVIAALRVSKRIIEATIHVSAFTCFFYFGISISSHFQSRAFANRSEHSKLTRAFRNSIKIYHFTNKSNKKSKLKNTSLCSGSLLDAG
jgi:hypothetical protein